MSPDLAALSARLFNAHPRVALAMRAAWEEAAPDRPDYREASRRLAALAEAMPDRCPNLRDYYPDGDAYEAAMARYRATCQGIQAARERLHAREEGLAPDPADTDRWAAYQARRAAYQRQRRAWYPDDTDTPAR